MNCALKKIENIMKLPDNKHDEQLPSVVSGNDKTEYEKIPCDGFDSEYNAKKRLQGI